MSEALAGLSRAQITKPNPLELFWGMAGASSPGGVALGATTTEPRPGLGERVRLPRRRETIERDVARRRPADTARSRPAAALPSRDNSGALGAVSRAGGARKRFMIPPFAPAPGSEPIDRNLTHSIIPQATPQGGDPFPFPGIFFPK